MRRPSSHSEESGRDRDTWGPREETFSGSSSGMQVDTDGTTDGRLPKRRTDSRPCRVTATVRSGDPPQGLESGTVEGPFPGLTEKRVLGSYTGWGWEPD